MPSSYAPPRRAHIVPPRTGALTSLKACIRMQITELTTGCAFLDVDRFPSASLDNGIVVIRMAEYVRMAAQQLGAYRVGDIPKVK